MHLQIQSDKCHSTIAPYFCIRGWAVGLSEAVVPQRQLPPQLWEHCQLGLMKCLVRPNKDGVATHCDWYFLENGNMLKVKHMFPMIYFLISYSCVFVIRHVQY